MSIAKRQYFAMAHKSNFSELWSVLAGMANVFRPPYQSHK